MGPSGSKKFKMLLLQLTAKSFQNFSWFSSQWSSQNYAGDFWNFEFLIFNDFCFRKFQIHYCSLWNKNTHKKQNNKNKTLSYLENEWL